MPGTMKKNKKPSLMYAGGGSMKPVPKGNKGLSKLPTKVRNKMGYAKEGGKLKMVEKGGKKVPFFAADGVGKMKEGGSTNQKKVDKVIKGLKKASKLHAGQAKSLGTLKMVRGGMASKEITSGKMATRKRKPAPKKAAKKANPKQPQKKSVFGRIKKMLGMKKTGGTVRRT